MSLSIALGLLLPLDGIRSWLTPTRKERIGITRVSDGMNPWHRMRRLGFQELMRGDPNAVPRAPQSMRGFRAAGVEATLPCPLVGTP
jgi:hypothetical protein